MAVEEINLNLIPGGVMPVCHASQYDIKRTIKVNLFNGNEPYYKPDVITGTVSAILCVRKPDGHIVTAETIWFSGSSSLTFTTDKQMTAVAGKNICELKIKIIGLSSVVDTSIGTLNFVMEVEKDPEYGGLTSESEIHDLEQQIADITTRQMANYYTKSETYSKGEINSTVDIINQQIGAKADSSSVYTKSQTDEMLSEKADSSSVYTKSQTDEMLSAKADAATTFTKNEVTTRLLEKADLDQITIKDGDINYVGSTSEPVLPYFYEVRTMSSSTVSVRESKSTASTILTTVNDGDILLIEEITAGESINHVPLWGYVVIQSGTESIEGYISMYYLRRLYNVTFNRSAWGSIVKKFAVNILPDQLGTGTPSFSNYRPIKVWTSIKVKEQGWGTIHNLELPFNNGVVAGSAELADGDGYCSSDYGYIDLGDMSWSTYGNAWRATIVAGDNASPAEDEMPDIYCEKLKPDTFVNVQSHGHDDSIAIEANSSGVIVYSSSLSSATSSEVQEALTGCKLAYRLATSDETDFSEYSTLSNTLITNKGTNYYWTDCGNITECKLDNIKVPGDTKIITGTLEAGQTTLALQDAAITDDAMYDLYTDTYGVNPTAVSVESGVITLTFEVQSSDVGVKIKVS